MPEPRTQTLDQVRTAAVVPAPRLLGLAALLTLVACLAPLWPAVAGLWVWGLLGLGLLALVDLLTRPPLDCLRVSRCVSAELHVGRSARMDLVVENRLATGLDLYVAGYVPAEAGGGLIEGVTRIAEQGKVEFGRQLELLRRGRFAFPATGLALRAGLGLLEYRRLYSSDEQMDIAPGRPAAELGWLVARAAVLEEVGQTRLRRLGADWEFESLRDYNVGDEIRRIDWKASARRHRPLVRQFETERNTELILALDCGRLMGSLVDGVRKVDLAMTPVLDLAAVALRRGERVGLLVFDSKPRAYLAPRPGMQQLHQMTSTLAGLGESDAPTSYLRAVQLLEARHKKRSTLVVFTDFTDEVTSRDLVRSLASLRRRHQTVFVAVADAHIRRIADGPAASEPALFEKAVAADLSLERRGVLDVVQNLGIPTLDAEPQKLSGPLLSRYLELRLSGVF